MTGVNAFTPTHTVTQNVLPIYAEPRRGSEQTSQAVFGAPLQAAQTDSDFTAVIGEDRYSGWVRTAFLTPMRDTGDFLTTTIATLFAEVLPEPDPQAHPLTRLTAGARVLIAHQPEIDSFTPILLPFGGIGYVHRGYLTATYEVTSKEFSLPGQQETGLTQARILEHLRERIEQAGRRFVGVPYLWGGATPFGMDCSGFVQLVYRLNGMLLLRDASLQFADRRFGSISEGTALSDAVLAPGDLVFFGALATDAPPKITHVGLALGDGTFVHSAGRDRGNLITPCDDDEFGATYVGARRLSADADLAIEAA